MEDGTFEVRDIRKKGVFILEDEFFNGYAKILSPYILAVYVCLCRHADKDQKCWPSQQKIAEELGISDTTVREAIKVLEFFKLVKKERVGKMCNNRYWLLDKKSWRKDFEVILKSLCSGEHKEFMVTTISAMVHSLKSLCSNSKEIHSKEIHSKDSGKNFPQSPTSIFNLEEEIKKLEDSPRRDLGLVAYLIRRKKLDIENKDQFQTVLQRHLADAKNLKPFSDEQIISAADKAEKEIQCDWTLGTLVKLLTK